jgi:hypothetical protein
LHSPLRHAQSSVDGPRMIAWRLSIRSADPTKRTPICTLTRAASSHRSLVRIQTTTNDVGRLIGNSPARGFAYGDAELSVKELSDWRDRQRIWLIQAFCRNELLVIGATLRAISASHRGVSPLANRVGLFHANTVNAPRSLAHHRGACGPPEALLQRLGRELCEGGDHSGDHPGWSPQLRRCEPQDNGMHCATAEFIRSSRPTFAPAVIDLQRAREQLAGRSPGRV